MNTSLQENAEHKIKYAEYYFNKRKYYAKHTKHGVKKRHDLAYQDTNDEFKMKEGYNLNNSLFRDYLSFYFRNVVDK